MTMVRKDVVEALELIDAAMLPGGAFDDGNGLGANFTLFDGYMRRWARTFVGRRIENAAETGSMEAAKEVLGLLDFLSGLSDELHMFGKDNPAEHIMSMKTEEEFDGALEMATPITDPRQLDLAIDEYLDRAQARCDANARCKTISESLLGIGALGFLAKEVWR